MSAAAAYKDIIKILERWPKDPLRPKLNFGPTVSQEYIKELESGGKLKLSSSDAQRQVRALETIESNRYKSSFELSSTSLNPPFNPDYYFRIQRETDPNFKMSRITRFFKTYFRWK